ncbi:MAG TPA: GAF domain-containing protein [Allosphingosinicella sp.]|nr:GAF domain-containing protein [Allosphingosinicella sp.]
MNLSRPSPDLEERRLAALRRYDILDTPPDGAFDRITSLAASIFSVPISIISLVDTDRIWFKSHHGIEVDEIGREPGLCASAILHEDPWVLTDAAKDVRALANPLVAGEFGLRFYAGAPLRTSDGYNLGTLCVIDREPRPVSQEDIARLEDLAAVVMDQMELRLAARRRLAQLEELVQDRDAQAERAGEAERRLNAVLDNASVAVFLMDERQHCAYMNAAAERLTGYTFSETQGRPLHDVIHHTRPDGSRFPLQECAIDRAFPENHNVQGEEVFVHKDGSFYPVSYTASPIRDETSSTIGTIIEVRNISAEKEAARILQAQTGHLETLNQTGAALAAELDLEKIVQIVTDAGVELTGARFGAFFYNMINEAGESFLLYTLAGADRSAFEKFGHPRATEVFAPTFKGKGVVRSNDITKDPRYGRNDPHFGMPKGHLPVRSYLAVPVSSRSGDVIGGLFFGHPDEGVFDEGAERLMLGLAGQAAIAFDNARLFEAARRANETLEQRVAERTSELEVAHEALRQAQKMEAIGQLTGGIAHDFNNLLTVITGSADLLRRSELPAEKRRRYVDAIADTAGRATKLTGQLLAFARRQALKPEPFDVAVRIHGIAEMLRTVLGSRVRLQIETDCDDCFVEADIAQFETALVNMAVNARDAMNGEGDLSIAISKDSLRAGMDAVTIRVTDTGHGIPADQLDRIFEPFFTTKDVGKGTGLGLSQVYGFVKQSDGEVAVESRPSGGTSFIISLPRVNAARAPSKEAENRFDQLSGGGRVLVVEDNPDVGEFASQLLTDLGYETVLAGDAQEALRLLDEDGAGFDIVFSDVVMPGMNGVEFGRKVREQLPGLPIVLTSGYSHILAEETKHGFPLLQKPYSLEALSRILRSAQRREI